MTNFSHTASVIWRLASVRPNQHRRAVVNLERQGYHCFSPQCLTTNRRGKKLVSRISPLFPGYVFVQIGADRPWWPVQSTYGVGSLVMRATNIPQSVPDEIITDLLARTGPDGLVMPLPDFAPGDDVRITAGPMTGFVARIERLSQHDRVSVLLEMMGQAIRVDLPRKYMTPVA